MFHNSCKTQIASSSKPGESALRRDRLGIDSGSGEEEVSHRRVAKGGEHSAVPDIEAYTGGRRKPVHLVLGEPDSQRQLLRAGYVTDRFKVGKLQLVFWLKSLADDSVQRRQGGSNG